MVFRGQPEKDSSRDAARFVVALQLQHSGQLGQRVDRPAGEADLLSGDDGEGFAARPAEHFVADVATPLAIGGDQGVREGGVMSGRTESPTYVFSRQELRCIGIARDPVERESVQAVRRQPNAEAGGLRGGAGHQARLPTRMRRGDAASNGAP